MNWKNLKIGTKLTIGFLLVICLSVVIGLSGYSGMQSLIDRIEKTQNANDVSKNVLNLRGYEKDYMFRHDEETAEDGAEVLQIVYSEIEESKLKFKDQKDLEDLDLLKQKTNNYKDALEEYVRIYKDEYTVNLQKTIKEGEKTIELAEALQLSQKQQMIVELEKEVNKNFLLKRFEKNELSNEILEYFAQIRIDAKGFVISRDPKDAAIVIEQLDQLLDKVTYTKNLMSKKDNIQQLEEMFNAVRAYKIAMQKTANVIALQENEAEIMDNSGISLINVADKLKDGQAKKMVKEEQRASSMIISFVILGVIIGIIMAIVISRNIISGIRKSVDFASLISEGDLNSEIDIKQEDEVGLLAASLNAMVLKLREIVVSINLGANNVASASQQISSSTQQLSEGATEQASSTEEVSSSMEEMTSNIQQNTDNAQQTEKISINAAEGVTKVAEASQESLISMKQIAEKITIINDIAFQTNILALNAAVEAARAGEHGKGFAVVAAEVRKLAERSKVAADEINELSGRSLKVTEEAGSLMADLMPEIEKTAKLVQEISAASLEQNSGADQVNSAIQQLNSVTQQNAAASEEMATSSEELASQAEQLKDIVGFFKVDELKRSTSTRNNLQEFKPKSKPMHSFHSADTKVKKEEGAKGFEIKLNNNKNLDNEFESF